MGTASTALVSTALLLIGGCAPRPLLDRAIAARGGPLAGLTVRVEDQVHAEIPGTWHCTRTFLVPDRYAWKIITTADPIYHLFDGTTVRCFIGGAEVSSDTNPCAPLRSHARWTAVVNLDALRGPDVVLTPLDAAELPEGVREGLSARFPDGAVYRLGFDNRTLLVWARGPLDFSPFGKGEASARFSDQRRAGPLVLPFATSYAFGTTPLVDETVLAACVDPAGLTPASFANPIGLPDCP